MITIQGNISSMKWQNTDYDYQAMLERWYAAVAAERAKDGFAFYYYNQDHLDINLSFLLTFDFACLLS